MLYQNLKCNANADIITSVWMVGREYPYPDFGIEKKCGDFEGLLEWSHAREVSKQSVDEGTKMPENGGSWDDISRASRVVWRFRKGICRIMRCRKGNIGIPVGSDVHRF